MGPAIALVSFRNGPATIHGTPSKPIYTELIHSCIKCGSVGVCRSELSGLRPSTHDGTDAIVILDVSSADNVQSILVTYLVAHITALGRDIVTIAGTLIEWRTGVSSKKS